MYGLTFTPATPTDAWTTTGGVTNRYEHAARLALAAVALPRVAAVGPYAAAIALVPARYESFTLLANQVWPMLPTNVTLCVAYNANNTTYRWKLASFTNPALPFDEYAGQRILNPTARIEYWVNAQAAGTINVPELTIVLGGLYDTYLMTREPDAVTPCVNAPTGDAGFASFMTSCPYTVS